VFKNEEIIWVKRIETIYYFHHHPFIHSFIYVLRKKIQICLKYSHFLKYKEPNIKIFKNSGKMLLSLIFSFLKNAKENKERLGPKGSWALTWCVNGDGLRLLVLRGWSQVQTLGGTRQTNKTKESKPQSPILKIKRGVCRAQTCFGNVPHLWAFRILNHKVNDKMSLNIHWSRGSRSQPIF
jgi:hypothetical protein